MGRSACRSEAEPTAHRIESFAAGFGGKLVSETMLLAGLNDNDASLAAVGEFLARLPLSCAYIGIPIRPTTDPEAVPPEPAVLPRAYEQLSNRLQRVELLISDEGDSFAASEDAADILSISAVHPLREAAVNALLAKNGADWSCAEGLLNTGELQAVEYGGERFYIRRWSADPGHAR